MRVNQSLSKLLALAAIVMLWPSLASSAVERRDVWISTTLDLLDLCTTPSDDALRAESINFCMGFIEGAVHYHDAISDHEEMERLICYPDTATLEEGILVFIDWAEENQGDKKLMEEPTVIGVVKALGAKWPCNQ